MENGEDTIKTADGLILYYQWQTIADARGVILIVHGVCEHIGRYRAMEDWFCAQGFSCYGYDQRGHGRSTGRRTHVADFSEYITDLQLITEVVQKREPGRPLYIFAHSMGAVVALLAVLRNSAAYRGLVLASPAVAIGSGVPGWVIRAGELLARHMPTLRVPSMITADRLSHDADVINSYKKDTLVESSVTLSWLTSMLKAQREILHEAPAFPLPLLILQSRADSVADIAGTYKLMERLPKDRLSFKEYLNLYHELTNEVEADRLAVLHDVSDWLNRQIDN